MDDNGWMPIKTAPKDGTAVLLYADIWSMTWGEIQIGHFEGDGEGSGVWVTGAGAVDENDPDFNPYDETLTDRHFCGDDGFGPTHWQPLPSPPLPRKDRP